jgi:DNA polymerase-3 subunit alpha
MVIGDRPLEELVPMYRDPKSSFPITQFNWKLVEAAGLVKFDFLGLKTLTVLTKAVELIARGRGIAVDLAMLDIGGSDPKVLAAYQLLAKADTVGVFQLESTGMRQSLIRLKPDRFEDIIAMVALYRPGPMDNIPTYINRKHGEEPVDYMHPMLEGILRETYGVIIYQEQVMQIAQVLAGYSLGDADLLRRAMGKKDKAEMAKQQARFVEGALKNGVKQKDAVEIFELVDKFAGYGFNKSHAAAYALVSYQTAYLKANYREEFLAASMTLDMGNTDKLAMFAGEAKRFGIAVKPPSINASEVDFLAEPPTKAGERGAIRYSLAALRNIGAGAVESLVQTRSDGGRFADVSDFARRFDPKAMNKRALETLAAAGAFDEFEPNRATAFANAEQMIALSNRLAADEAAGTSDLFGGGGAPRVDVRAQKPWTAMERLNREFEAVGFFLSGHPLDEYQSVLTKLGTTTYADVEASAERGQIAARIAAIVVSIRIKKSAKGNTFAFAMFSDKTGQFEAVIFSDALTQARDILEPGTAVLLSLEGERDGETLKLRTQSVESLEAAASRIQRSLCITLDGRAVATPDRLASLRALLRPGRQSEVRMRIEVAERSRAIEVVLPGRYDVTASHRGEIATLPGVLDVEEV